MKKYTEKDGLVEHSLSNKELFGLPYCILPLCHTVEAEALGAKVKFSDDGMEPRIREFVFSEIEQLREMQEFDFEKGRISQVLAACLELHKKGEHIILEVSGPLTILNGLLDIQFVLKAMRKKPELMIEIFNWLGVQLINYMSEAKKCGVEMISYADPIGAIDILGSKTALWLVEEFTLPFLKKVEELSDEHTLIVLCPKITNMLVKFNVAALKEVTVSDNLDYGQGCIEMIGKAKIIGTRCIKASKSKLHSPKMKEIVVFDTEQPPLPKEFI